MQEKEAIRDLPVLKVRKIHPGARMPAYARAGDAGMDLCACEGSAIKPGAIASLPTGLILALPPGTEGQVRPRSGLAARHAVTVLNSPGTIDEGYRGELRVLLINHGSETFQVEPGMRIAQLVVSPVTRVAASEVESLDVTQRNRGGFGSTGIF